MMVPGPLAKPTRSPVRDRRMRPDPWVASMAFDYSQKAKPTPSPLTHVVEVLDPAQVPR